MSDNLNDTEEELIYSDSEDEIEIEVCHVTKVTIPTSLAYETENTTEHQTSTSSKQITDSENNGKDSREEIISKRKNQEINVSETNASEVLTGHLYNASSLKSPSLISNLNKKVQQKIDDNTGPIEHKDFIKVKNTPDETTMIKTDSNEENDNNSQRDKTDFSYGNFFSNYLGISIYFIVLILIDAPVAFQLAANFFGLVTLTSLWFGFVPINTNNITRNQ